MSTDAVRASLAELVTLKDLKDEESRLRQRRECTRLRGSEEARRKVDAMRDEYNRRKPLAWAAARAALSEPAPGDVAQWLASVGSDGYRTDEERFAARILLRIAAATSPAQPAGDLCQPNGLMFDALGEPRTRYVRVTLGGNHCVMHPSDGDTYLKDARDNGDDSPYVVRDVYLSEREFDDLPEHDGF